MLLLCAAPELDRAYERVFAYILDDLNRRYPCVELLCTVGAHAAADRLQRRRLLGPAGPLRRHGLVRAHGENATTLRQEVRAATGIVEFLLGGGADLAALAHDPGAVVASGQEVSLPHVDAAMIVQLGTALRNGTANVLGVWG